VHLFKLRSSSKMFPAVQRRTTSAGGRSLERWLSDESTDTYQHKLIHGLETLASSPARYRVATDPTVWRTVVVVGYK
jgi:hypothetical protein